MRKGFLGFVELLEFIGRRSWDARRLGGDYLPRRTRKNTKVRKEED